MAKYLNLAGLQTLWAKLKDTFLSKDSPAGQIFEFPYNSKDYTLDDLNQLASEGKTIRCVLPDNGVRLTLYYIGPGPGNIDVAKFIGPCIPDSSGGSAYSATMNSNKDWTSGTTHSQYSWSNLIGNQPAPIAHTHGANMAEIAAEDGDANVTDGTDLVTSYADENGYTTGHPKAYRRKAFFLWNYIKGKLTSVSGVNVSGSSTKLEIAGRISASGSNFHDAQYALVATSTDAGSAAQISCYRFNNGSSSNNSPFSDGMVINIPWSSMFGVQIAIEDKSYTEYKRYLNKGIWSSWFRTMNSDGYASRVKRVGCCQWDAGDSSHIGSFTCSADALANYSNFLVHDGDNTPSTPFMINSNDLNGETWYSFKFPKGGTLRYNNQRTSTVWIKYNGDSPSVAAGKTYDFPVAPGGVLELYWNWGSGLYVVCDTPKKDVGNGEWPVYLKDGKITQCIVGFKINELSTSGSYISFV